MEGNAKSGKTSETIFWGDITALLKPVIWSNLFKFTAIMCQNLKN